MNPLFKHSFLTFLVCICTFVPLFAQQDVEVFVADFANDELRLNIEQNASTFLSTINSSSPRSEINFSDTAKFADRFNDAFNELWENTPFYIPETTIIETVNRLTNGTYEMRNIPAYFLTPEGEELYEETVLQFDADGRIINFRIGLPAHRYQNLMLEGEDVTDQANRAVILQFVEQVRTAYNRKDLEFINTVFSDQALIIVGSVVQNTGDESAYQQQVEYLQFTKDEYIQRLSGIFSRNEWIDVGYEDIGIFRHPKHPEIYGVSLTQYYNSSTYSDDGYLFLLIDFKNPDQPVIHVRTWQPKNSTPEDEIFHIGYMEIF